MATRRKPPPDDAERLAELERLAHTARTKGVREETETEQYLRRVDEHGAARRVASRTYSRPLASGLGLLPDAEPGTDPC